MKYALLLASLVPSAFGATQLTFSGYSYNTPPNGSYPDSGGELTDGVATTIAWGNGIFIGFNDVIPLVGWQNSGPSITFTFASPVTVTSIVAYFADSDGWAGVGLPASVNLSDGGAFNQNFTVNNPAGDGTTVPVLLDGFSISASSLTLSATPGYQWTMLSEVQAFDATAVPEPASGAALAGAAALGFLASRRRRQA